jgi:hypothetical protein
MTVVATDGKTIAADSLTTFGYERSGQPAQKIVCKGGKIYAYAGVTCLFPVLIDWHLKGADPGSMPKMGDEEWSMLVIDRDGMNLYSSAPYPLKVAAPFAIGNAANFALGALALGVSSKAAVEVAIKLSTVCGGEIQVIDISEALGLKTLEAAE